MLVVVVEDHGDLLSEKLVLRAGSLVGAHQVLQQDHQLPVLIEAPGLLDLLHEHHYGIDEVTSFGGTEDQDLIPGNIHSILMVARNGRK